MLRGARFAQPEGGRERIFDAQFHLSDDDAPPFVTATPTTADAPPPAVAAAPSDGLLSPALIRATTVAHLGEVVACHERGLAAQPDASGQVVVRFVIAGDGVVASSVVTRSTYPLPWVARCVADAVRGWRFPGPRAAAW